ncbi:MULTISPECIES: D-2-hydroxyacid dehydrogenase family protein [Arthrobacter]|uniref:D-2-hydroxyacid dehydrogenase family protein n=1 Tax=Arthrobacter terricola TaxID=2547396 RepID=A0A4R5KAM4_9MICC|nr:MULTISPECIES: D-2-hydroxyacid dehydrogenase family protein [Arthrobacter]MBT8162248.1 D-2-hydroxyacid dehydrogenase family protein [Arthrobacter sp. GN70]TDF92273.1 D-2-hydroxyacid dehydrogenase family protein [Arthrobacter terricola]
MRQRLAILDDYQAVAYQYAPWDDLADDGIDVTVFTEPFAGDQETVAALRDFDAVMAMRERTVFDAARLGNLPRLKLLVTTGMANAAIDLAAAKDLGITVCGTGGSPDAAPELTWALLLAFARKVPFEDNRLRAGHWQSTVGFELSGKTLGVLGLGRIGSKVAGYGQAFGMDVIAWSPNLTEETAAAAGARKVGKEALFREADVVSVHVRLSERSRGLVGEDELRLLGPYGVLVNTSRGPVVDEAALLRGLNDGWFGGAALDVYDVEPLPADHPLLTAPRTVLTPHLGYVTSQSYARFYGEAFEDVRAWAQGVPLRVISA